MKKADDILAGLEVYSLSEKLEELHTSRSLTAFEQLQRSQTLRTIEALQLPKTIKALEDGRASTLRAVEATGLTFATANATHLATVPGCRLPTGIGAKLGLANLNTCKMHADSNRLWAKAAFAPDFGLKADAGVQAAYDRLARSALPTNLITPLASLPALTRTNQWALSLLKAPPQALAAFYPGLAQQSALNDIMKAARGITDAVGGGALGGALGLATSLTAGFADTAFKLSTLVGATDVHGLDAGITTAAYHSLFGEWRTRPDLPERFWRDPSYRRAAYRDAQVDEGLVEADVAVSLDMMIDSGLAGGFREDGRSAAFLTYGGVTLSIRSKNLRGDAYHVVGEFEETMRAFIAAKLQAKEGAKWFTQRVDGKVVEKAKGARGAAVKRDEAPLTLINYTDLGELSSIILRGPNWSEVFESIFINKAEFDHDMQKLVALRRPTAHYRKIDGPRLMEAMCVMDRLDRRMKQDGGWKAALESEE